MESVELVDPDVASLRAQATGSAGEGWEARFAALLDDAGSKGWLSADGTGVLAHVVETE